MKLTKEDKNLLLAWGHSESDLKQIQEAANVAKYKILSGVDFVAKKKIIDRRIGVNKAIYLLGRLTWLSGIARAAFHRNSVRNTCDETYDILIDCSALFS